MMIVQTDSHAAGKIGAPWTGGVAPGFQEFVNDGGAFVAIPIVMFARRGMPVPVSNGGGPVRVVVEAETCDVVVPLVVDDE